MNHAWHINFLMKILDTSDFIFINLIVFDIWDVMYLTSFEMIKGNTNICFDFNFYYVYNIIFIEVCRAHCFCDTSK
jgi:hypothetical protein